MLRSLVVILPVTAHKGLWSRLILFATRIINVNFIPTFWPRTIFSFLTYPPHNPFIISFPKLVIAAVHTLHSSTGGGTWRKLVKNDLKLT